MHSSTGVFIDNILDNAINSDSHQWQPRERPDRGAVRQALLLSSHTLSPSDHHRRGSPLEAPAQASVTDIN